MTSLRERLRSLPTFSDVLPGFDAGATPDAPAPLFLRWLDDAIAAGGRFPHATVFSTVDEDGRPDARVLILKDVTDVGFEFATRTDGAKAAQLAAHPAAAMTFFWPELGRQVRIRGHVSPAGAEVSALDDAARAPRSRAAARLGVQSSVLPSSEEYPSLLERETAAVLAEPTSVTSTWAVQTLTPETIEFFASTAGQGQVRLRYRRTPEGWHRDLLWP